MLAQKCPFGHTWLRQRILMPAQRPLEVVRRLSVGRRSLRSDEQNPSIDVCVPGTTECESRKSPLEGVFVNLTRTKPLHPHWIMTVQRQQCSVNDVDEYFAYSMSALPTTCTPKLAAAIGASPRLRGFLRASLAACLPLHKVYMALKRLSNVLQKVMGGRQPLT